MPHPPADAAGTLPDAGLAALTDRCVQCGLCLPQCPTYHVERIESASPRGRVALAEALARGTPPDPLIAERLDGCLVCRRCEAVCPAGVEFGRIIDAARARIAPARRTPIVARLAAWALRRPLLRRLLANLARLAITLRVPRWLRAGLPGRLAGMLPDRWTLRSGGGCPATPPAARRVRLFVPCAAQIADPATEADARALLAALGVAVDARRNQACCGALAWHAGDAAAARQDQRRLLDELGDDPAPLVCTATGCSLMLAEHAQIHADGAAVAAQAMDLCALLDELTEGRAFAALDAVVALQIPCSQRNGLRQADTVRRLLGRIPELRVVETGVDGRCCGAGGDNFLRRPDIAERLAAEHLETLRGSGARILVCANVGCAMHLRGAARRAGLAIEVLHPATLLRRQLQPAVPAPSPAAAAADRPARPG